MAEKKSRGILTPVIGGLVVVVGLFLIVALWGPITRAVSSSSGGGKGILDWIPGHWSQSIVILGWFLAALALNYVAHIAGRLYAWVFVLVVEVGVWFLFWNRIGIDPLKNLINLDGVNLSVVEQFVGLLIVLVLSGIVFWILEAKEAAQQRAHRLNDTD